MGNKPQNNTARLYRPLWFQSCRKDKSPFKDFDNPGLNGQESGPLFRDLAGRRWESPALVLDILMLIKVFSLDLLYFGYDGDFS